MMWDLSGGSGQPQEHAAYYYYSQSSDSMYSPPSYSAPAPFMPIAALSSGPEFQQRAITSDPYYQPSPGPVLDRAIVTSTHHHRSRQSHHHQSSHTRQHQARPAPVVYQPAPPLEYSPPSFQYSKCTGRRKAVCIGINYYGQPNQLHGCVNDARNVRNFLIQHYNYKSEDVVLLTDDSSHARSQPTKANIRDAMRWLVQGAQPHDSLFFHYSGHGGQTKDLDGDEIDGYDEVIFPVDYKQSRHIVDDEMHRLMVDPLPVGCRLTAVFDSCHSGSVLDLPYLYHSDGRVKGSQVTADHIREKSTRADVISWSGCMDSQTSADTYDASGVATGAMSYAFMTCLRENPNASYQGLLQAVRRILRKNYSQKPQLSSSHPIDTNLKFIM
ncbi:hypothetical protein OBBRIDRAFT_791973 [Obba rivulosa]|uniref:Peptidase C14 caspase domain-containing protein n=1 Tax=Obba rivulosa TaxID=1052685 RepID=A0A8E2AWQ7_9APHY|nr:hypothetical protein OBBRIDRAFT_791973 [Obba rivulosa]